MQKIRLYGVAAGTVFLWGASFPLTKIAMEELGSTSVAFARWSLSAVILWVWWVVREARKGRTARETLRPFRVLVRTELVRLVWVSLTGITLFYWLECTALQYTTVINTGVLSNFTSVFLVLIGTIWLHERLEPMEWLAMVIAFGGALIVSLGAGRLSWSGTGLIGDGMMVVASFFGAIYSIGGKRLVIAHEPAVIMTGVAAVGALFLLPLAVQEGLPAQLSWKTWGAIVLLSAGSGALANLWWLELLSRVEASRAGVTLFMIPVVSTILAIGLLGEHLTLPVFLGSVAVLLGVAMVQQHSGRAAEKPAPCDQVSRVDVH